MSAQRARDTGIELALRRRLHSRGLRFRLHRKIAAAGNLRPDIVFPTEKVAIFVDGCFWHLCPEHGSLPDANHEWWEGKLRANVARDHRQNEVLLSNGWAVLRIWEHEDLSAAADTVEELVRSRRR